MKVAKLYNFNDIRIEDMPIPKVGPREALVKTRACGICSGDVMPWYIEKKAPLVLGHEPAGEIVELGSSLKIKGSKFKIKDRVFIHHHAPCLNCKYCFRGDYVQCETWKNSRIIPGGISEYILVPEINLLNDTLLLPENITYEDATLIEPTACVVKSLKRAKIKERDNVLIIGLGVMGQIQALLLKKFGAEKIIGADMIDYRLKRALDFGADYVIDVSKDDLCDSLKDITKGYMANIVIVNPNSLNAIKSAINCVSRGGTIVLFTPVKPGEILSVDPNFLYFKDISIVTSYSCGPDDTMQALEYIKEGLVTANKIVSHKFSIDDTERAYRITAEARNSLKCLIIF